MAEHYGVKPKMFTKDWWPYYWMYYKWYTIAAVAIVAFIVMIIYDCVTKEKYDLEITYYGSNAYLSEMWEELDTTLEEYIEDIDDNGEQNILMIPLVMSDKSEDMQMSQAAYTQYTMSFTDTLSYLYIYDQAQLDILIDEDIVNGTFLTTDKWLKSDVSEDSIVYGKNSKAYAISLKDSKIINSIGLNGEDLYVLVKDDTKNPKQDEKVRKNAIIAANELIK